MEATRFRPADLMALHALPPCLPLPEALFAAERPWSFVGRELEMSAIHRALDATEAAARRLVLISGEPGVGKTTLAAEAACDAYKDGATVLHGRAEETPVGPFQPFAEALSHLVHHAPQSTLAKLGNGGAEVARLVPAVGHRLGTLPSTDTGSYALFSAVASLLGAGCGTSKLVLVLEDLHWADAPSLALLRHLMITPEPLRLLVLATYRDTEISPSSPLAAALASLEQDGRAVRLRLEGLQEHHLVDIMRSLTGGSLSDDQRGVARRLHRDTGGNALFATEALRDVARSEGVLARRPSVPPSVSRAILRRADRLGAPAREVLSVAAVVGRRFDPELIAAAGDVDLGVAARELEQAQAAGLVRSEAGTFSFAFVHPVIRTALAESLGASGRVRTHGSVAASPKRLWPGEAPGSPSPTRAPRAHATLTRRGELWTLALAGSEVGLRDAKGVRYLAQLTRDPRVETSAVELQLNAEGTPPARGSVAEPVLPAGPPGGGDAGPLLDAKAKRAYRLRIEDLRDQLEEAQRFQDFERATRAREELDFVGAQLAAALGLGGRDRRAASGAERARVNVTRALRGSIRRIATTDPVFGRHLERSVKTGTFCVYDP